ncbi:MAG TPA: hypothetical protein VKG45_14530 [Actinomycetes bacterium]|nr:hypothetical protein [Actinomycetes bacterium]
MARDLAELLRQAAHVPAEPLDAGDLRRRGRRLRRRRRVVRGVALTVLLVMVPVGMAGIGYLRSREPGVADRPAVTVPPPPEAPPQRTANAIRPPTRAEGSDEVMPVVFLDGTSAEVVYPKALDLAGLRARPAGSAELAGCCARDFFVPPGGAAWFADAGERLARLSGAGGRQVTVWPAPESEGAGRYLVFQFGSWWVGVWDQAGGSAMTDQQLADWAAHLDGQQTSEGFLVLRPDGPLRLVGPGTAKAAPRLEFGAPDERMVALTLGPCPRASTTRSADGAQLLAETCRPEWAMSVEVHGDPDWVESVLDGLKIRGVRAPP